MINHYPLYSDHPTPDIEGVHIDWIEHINGLFHDHQKEGKHLPNCPTCLWCWNEMGLELIHLNTEVAQVLQHLRVIYTRAEGIEEEWAIECIQTKLDKWLALYSAIGAPFRIERFTLPFTGRPVADAINEAGVRFAKEVAKKGQVEI